MARLATSVTVMLGLLAAGLAGCLGGGDSKGSTSADAPQWRAGYSWTYELRDVGTREVVGYDLDDFGPDPLVFSKGPESVTLTVINTTADDVDEPAYYVETSGEVGTPWMHGDLLALSKGNLTQIGVAWTRPPEPEDDSGPVPDCGYGGVGVMWATPVWRFPLLQFPLDEGRTWNWSIPSHPVDTYNATVMGSEVVDTLAGSMEAVHVHIELGPNSEEMPLYLSGQVVDSTDYSVSGYFDLWYSGEVQNLVRLDYSRTDGYVQGPNSSTNQRTFSFSLSSYDLTEVPETPLSGDGSAPGRPPPPQFEIVTDTDFPLNVADGPVTARFGVRSAPYASYVIQKVDAVPEFDGTVKWSVDQGSPVTTDVLELAIDRGGQHTLSASIVGADPCASSVAGGTFVARWSKTFTVSLLPGLAAPVPVGDVVVEDGSYWGDIEWAWTPFLPIRIDNGTPMLRWPDGSAVPIEPAPDGADRGRFYPFTGGVYALEWVPSGTVIVGDDVAVTVSVEYSYSGFSQ